MSHAHFLVLTGRLNEFPLHELVETLRGQRKTGRLHVEFKAGPAALYFREGALVDARMGTLRGLEALALALSLQHEDAAPFNFNPLVASPDAPHAPPPPAPEPGRDPFARGGHRGADAPPRARVIEVEPESPDADILDLGSETRALPPAPDDALIDKLTRIEDTVVAQGRRANVERAAYAALFALLIVLAFVWRGGGSEAGGGRTPDAAEASAPVARPAAADPTAEAATAAAGDARNASGADAPVPPKSPEAAGAKTRQRPNADRAPQTPAAVGQTADATNAPDAQEAGAPAGREPDSRAGRESASRDSRSTRGAGGHVVQVRMTVERGRVLRAEVSNPRPGMGAYEALALRMARQRRFPEEFSGQETLRLKVGQ
jgi:hypothetical protein